MNPYDEELAHAFFLDLNSGTNYEEVRRLLVENHARKSTIAALDEAQRRLLEIRKVQS